MKKLDDLSNARKTRWDFPALIICILLYGCYLYFVKGERFDAPPCSAQTSHP